jgi:hypothetical protein
MTEDFDGETAEIVALVYFARSNVDFSVGGLID